MSFKNRYLIKKKGKKKGKEWRKPYEKNDPRNLDWSRRNNKSCGYCRANRLYSKHKRLEQAKELQGEYMKNFYLNPETNREIYERIKKELDRVHAEINKPQEDGAYTSEEKKHYVIVKLKDGTYLESPALSKKMAFGHLSDWENFIQSDLNDYSIYSVRNVTEGFAISFHVRDVLYFRVREG